MNAGLGINLGRGGDKSAGTTGFRPTAPHERQAYEVIYTSTSEGRGNATMILWQFRISTANATIYLSSTQLCHFIDFHTLSHKIKNTQMPLYQH